MKECAKYIWLLSRNHRMRLAGVTLLGIVNIFFGLFFIWVSKGVVDVATGHDHSAFWPMVGLMFGVMILRIALMGCRQYILRHTDIRLVNSIRQRLFRQVMQAPWKGREDLSVGDTMSRLGEDLRVVTTCLTSDMPSLILSLCQLLAASWFLFMLQPMLLVALLALTPLAIVFSKVFYKVTRKLTQQIRQQEADITSHMQESLLHRPLLLSLLRVPLMIERLGNRQSELEGTYHRRIRFTVQARLFIHFAFMCGYALAFVWGAHGIMMGTVTYGMMVAFLQLVAQVQHPILNMSELLPQFVQSTTAADRLRQLPGEQIVQDEQYNLNDAITEPQDITISHLTYRYPDGTSDILNNLSVSFSAGSTTAIIGPTGSGKSTFVRLLLGLLQPSSGKIDIANQRIAYVPQGNSMLRGTIRDNLLLGKLDASDDELREALRRASALFVYDLPEGLNTLCGEKGSGLSEGQAQRLAIARALLQPGTVMILDEASSALDPQTEKQILMEIQQMQMGKTIIWVTHHEVVRDYMQQVIEIL